jgi:hypothetical protein
LTVTLLFNTIRPFSDETGLDCGTSEIEPTVPATKTQAMIDKTTIPVPIAGRCAFTLYMSDGDRLIVMSENPAPVRFAGVSTGEDTGTW